MTPVLAQRQLALAAVALLAALGALGIAAHRGKAHAAPLPQPVTLQNGQWRTNLAGATLPRYGRRTDCGIVLRANTIGVADSVLPCGVKLYLQYQESPRILTQVIEHRPVESGRKFELTPLLAEKLGLDGVQQVQWVFAGTAPG